MTRHSAVPAGWWSSPVRGASGRPVCARSWPPSPAISAQVWHGQPPRLRGVGRKRLPGRVHQAGSARRDRRRGRDVGRTAAGRRPPRGDPHGRALPRHLRVHSSAAARAEHPAGSRLHRRSAQQLGASPGGGDHARRARHRRSDRDGRRSPRVASVCIQSRGCRGAVDASLWILTTVAACLLVAVAAASFPAHVAARTRPALVLRSE